MMKKPVSILLSVLLVLPVIAAFCVGVAAESTYEELWEKKRAYEEELGYVSLGLEYIKYVCYGDDYGEGGDNLGYGWAFVLFTEKGKELTYQMETRDKKLSGYEVCDYWEFDSESVLTCIELVEMIRSCYKKEYPGHSSPYRNVVKSLGVTAKELKEAYRKMKEEPECARDLLPFMTNEEFDEFAIHLKSRRVPPDFVIEAACHDNDVEAEMLLAVPGNVYVKEWGCTVSCVELLWDPSFDIEKVARCDMTTDSFILFVKDMEEHGEWLGWHGHYKDEKGRSLSERQEYLVAEQARQLAAAKTGDGAVTALWVVALALPTLAAVWTVGRKRRI